MYLRTILAYLPGIDQPLRKSHLSFSLYNSHPDPFSLLLLVANYDDFLQLFLRDSDMASLQIYQLISGASGASAQKATSAGPETSYELVGVTAEVYAGW